MSRAQTRISGDPTPVTGGVKPPGRLLRKLSAPAASMSGSALDKHIRRLLLLHKDVAVKFRSVDLAGMDVAAKRALLTKINALLRIEPNQFPTA